MKPWKTILVLGVLAGVFLIAQETGLVSLLRSEAGIGRQSGGFYLLPTNQLLRPWGEQSPIPGRPVDLAFDSTQRLLAVLNYRGVWLMDGSSGAKLAEVPSKSTSYAGVAFRPGDRELWASEATRNGPDSILIAELNELGLPVQSARIALEGHPVPAGIAFSADGATAYVAFSRNNTLAVIDAATRRVKQEIPVGIAPFAVAAANQQGRIFVTNRGGRRPRPGDAVAPTSGSLVASDPVTGAAVSGTVTVIDSETLAAREIPVGLAPSGMALSPDQRTLAVVNGHSDSVSLLDARSLAKTEVKIPSWPDSLGSQPVAAAFAPDGNTLYLACGGTNAIAVLTAGKAWKVAGAVPTGWFPSGLLIDREGSLRIVNIKGTGNTANPKGNFNSRQYEGSLVKIPAPAPSQLAAATREVRAANTPKFAPAGGVSNLSALGIRHVFFIIKENRTYDQVFGDIAKGNGDPRLVFFGGT